MPEMESSVSRTVAIVRAVDQQLDVAQRQKVLSWAQALLDIRTGRGSARSKAIAAIDVTRHSGLIGELLERMIAMASEAGWKNRGWPARLGLGAALGTVVTVGTGNAGIAALGGAVGVPLWIVLGAGGHARRNSRRRACAPTRDGGAGHGPRHLSRASTWLMFGAIAGDVIGSVYERFPVRSTDFPLFPRRARFTDDTVLTVATAQAILEGGNYREA
jgi:hypothetical protein